MLWIQVARSQLGQHGASVLETVHKLLAVDAFSHLCGIDSCNREGFLEKLALVLNSECCMLD